MTKLSWNTVGERFYEIGVDRGVLYVDDNAGVAWNGLVSIEENTSGGDAKSFYIDGVKYLNLPTAEEFEATISAFYSPPEFDVCDGLSVARTGLFATQQRRKSFGLSYRTRIGNDLAGENFAYKIHIIYNALAQPSKRNYATMDNRGDAPLLSWDITTKPVFLAGVGYSAHFIVDTTTAPAYAVQTLEDILYGDEDDFPRLPTVDELASVFEDSAPLVVTDIGNDEFTISGSGFEVMEVDETTYQITSDAAVLNDDGTTTISSE